MHFFRQSLMIYISIWFLFISIIDSSQLNVKEQYTKGTNHQDLTAAQLEILNQLFNRRSVYDPAFGDSWSKYLKRKRKFFDPAYNDWADRFK